MSTLPSSTSQRGAIRYIPARPRPGCEAVGRSFNLSELLLLPQQPQASGGCPPPGQGSGALGLKVQPWGNTTQVSLLNLPRAPQPWMPARARSGDRPETRPGYQKSELNLDAAVNTNTQQALGGKEVSNYRADLTHVDRLS